MARLTPGLLTFTAVFVVSRAMVSGAATTDWPEYLGGPERNHASPAAQINATNVERLTVAWEYHTGDPGEMQCNPIVVNGIVYGTTASNQIFALEGSTGQELWRFAGEQTSSNRTLRGVAYWRDQDDERVLFSLGSDLWAVNARTGKVIVDFGQAGRVSLKTGLGPEAAAKWVVSTTPGTVVGNVIIMPIRVQEEPGAAPGFIQAFDVRTGDLAWTFHTIPLPGEYGYDTWPPNAYKSTSVGGANSWAGMAVDRERGLLFVPTGSASPDFWGGNRIGQNLFANCLLALDAKTGERRWHYQFVHHDLWDRDLPAPPVLLKVHSKGRAIDAVAQVTKSGYVFVFDRVTGESLFPIEEIPVPASDLTGEQTWPTQPRPTKPAPFARQKITENDLNPYSSNPAALRATFKAARHGEFIPFSGTPTLLLPGFDGGAEWGGAAADEDGILYVNSTEMAWMTELVEMTRDEELYHLSPGNRLYESHCAGCHGSDRNGKVASGFPSLTGFSGSGKRDHLIAMITQGKGMMPGFPALSNPERQKIADFLLGEEKVEGTALPVAQEKEKTPYKLDGYVKFIDESGFPGISPPWGKLSAIDLNTGEYRWQIVLGEFKELSAKGIPPTGAENYGGPIITRGGLLFIAATKDGMFRAFDTKTGARLWETKLPAPGFATPCTYEVNGKQFVVVACGGSKLGTVKGDSYIAFALP